MKIVELKIDDRMISGFDATALVESPATQLDFIAFNKVKMQDMTHNDYPQAAVDAAKRGIEINKELGNRCATQVGKVRAQQLANREPLSIDTIQRMRSFLIRQKGNYELAQRRRDYTACGYVSYLLWGGEAALPWAEKKLRQAGVEFSKFERYRPWNEFVDSAGGFSVGDYVSWTFAGRQEDSDRARGQIKDIRVEGEVKIPDTDFVFKPTKERPLALIETRDGTIVGQYVDNLRKIQKPEGFNEDDIIEEMIKDSLNLDVYGYPTEYFYMCPGAKATFDHLVSMNLDEETQGMVRSAAQIADNIFDLEEDVIEDKLATPEDVELASILISDFKDLISEIDEITGMVHPVDYMDAHLEVIQAYLPSEDGFELEVGSLPNYSNEVSGSLIKKDLFAELKEKQMLVGPLMTPGKLIDREDEETKEIYQVFFTADTIQQIAYKMMQDKLVDAVNIEHDKAKRVNDVYLVETWIVLDPEKDKSLLYGFKPIKGQWYGMYKVGNKKVWDEYVKTGKVKGFSVEGYFYNNILKNK